MKGDWIEAADLLAKLRSCSDASAKRKAVAVFLRWVEAATAGEAALGIGEESRLTPLFDEAGVLIESLDSALAVDYCNVMLSGLSNSAVCLDAPFWKTWTRFVIYVSRKPSIVRRDSQENVIEETGKEVATKLIGEICCKPWNSSLAVAVSTDMLDMPLKFQQRAEILDKYLYMLDKVPHADVASLGYQAVLLSLHPEASEEDSARCLERLGNLLSDANLRGSDEFDQIESVLLVQLTFLTKHHPRFGLSLLAAANACLKSSSANFSLLLCGLLLALSGAPSNEVKVFTFLKSAVYQRCKAFALWSEAAGIHFLKSCPPLPLDALCLCTEKALLEISEKSGYAWEPIQFSLAKLGVHLLHYGCTLSASSLLAKNDSFSISTGLVTLKYQLTETLPRNLQIAKRVLEFAFQLLTTLFRAQKHMQNCVVSLLLATLIKTPSLSEALHTLLLLNDLVVTDSSMMARSASLLNSVVDVLPQMHPVVAKLVLCVFKTSVTAHSPFRERLILTLRKAVSSGDSDSRETAMHGLCELLQSLGDDDEDLKMELFQLIKRGAAQQCTMRKSLYEFIQRNSSDRILRAQFLELLYTQTEFLFTDTPQIFRCIGASGQVSECVGPLLQAYVQVWIFLKLEDDSSNEYVTMAAQLERLAESIVLRPLQDFEIYEISEFAQHVSSTGVFNVNLALAAMHIIEALLCYYSYALKTKTEMWISLFQKFDSIFSIIKQRATLANGKKFTSSNYEYQISIESIRRTFDHIYSTCGADDDDCNGRATQKSSIEKNPAACQYLFTAAQQHICSTISSHLADPVHASKWLKKKAQLSQQVMLIAICDVLVDQFQDDSVDEKGGGSQIVFQAAMDCFMRAINFTATYEPSSTLYKLCQQVCETLAIPTEGDTEGEMESFRIFIVIRLFLKFAKVLMRDEKSRIAKDAAHTLLRAAHLLIETLGASLESSRIGSLSDQVRKMVCDGRNSSTPCAASLLKLHIGMEQLKGNVYEALGNIETSIRALLGTWDSAEMPTDPALVSADCKFVDNSNIFIIVHELCQWISLQLDRLGVLLGLIKGWKQRAQCPLVSQHHDYMGGICSELLKIVRLLSLFEQWVATSEIFEAVSRCLPKLFKHLTDLVKLYQNLNAYSTLPDFLFKLVAQVSKSLLPGVYTMITNFQQSQITQLQQLTDRENQNGASFKGKAPKKLENAQSGKRSRLGNSFRGSIMKELKTIPQLIFLVEQYERFLIALSKKLGSGLLLEHMKRSTARDFKIKWSTLLDIQEAKAASCMTASNQSDSVDAIVANVIADGFEHCSAENLSSAKRRMKEIN